MTMGFFFFTTTVSVTDQFRLISCISWFASEVSKQLRAGMAAADVKVSLKLSVIKTLYAKWIVDLNNTIEDDKEMAMNFRSFRSAGIAEAIENAKDMIEKVENPFKEI